MPFSVDYFPELNVIWLKFEGDVTIEEEFEAVRLPTTDERWFPEAKILADRRHATMSMGPEHIAPQLADIKTAFAAMGHNRVALVVPRDYDFGMARMFEMKTEGELGHDFHVFRAIEDAAAWLEIDLEDLEP